MEELMFRSHRVLIAALVSVIALVAIPLALGDQSYTDPSGDSKTGPDITGVTVSNDAAGVLTFRVTTVAPINTLTDVYVDLDTDANPATGLFGNEYSIYGFLGGFGLEKASGTTFVDTPAPSLSMTISGNVVEFKINRQDIGSPSRFGFDAATVLYDTSDKYVSEDDAPDGGSFIYSLAFSQCSNGKDDDGDGKVDAADLGCSSSTDNLESDDPVTLKAGKATVAPAKPKAGKLVVVSAPVTRVETGLGVNSGTAKCVARVGTASVSAKAKVAGGRGSCTFKTPAKSKGKTARGTITVTVLGKPIVIPFSFKVG
jgi:hypothetical protein